MVDSKGGVRQFLKNENFDFVPRCCRKLKSKECCIMYHSNQFFLEIVLVIYLHHKHATIVAIIDCKCTENAILTWVCKKSQNQKKLALQSNSACKIMATCKFCNSSTNEVKNCIYITFCREFFFLSGSVFLLIDVLLFNNKPYF